MNEFELELLIDLVNEEIQDITDFLHGHTDIIPYVKEFWLGKRLAYRDIAKKLIKMYNSLDTINE